MTAIRYKGSSMNIYRNIISLKSRWQAGWIGLTFLFLLLLLMGATSLAEPVNDDLENQVRKIAHQLRCPTCQAMSVKESEAGLSVNMKNKIREMLLEGKSENEITEFFVERYGEWILRSPQKEGFNLILWLAPLVIIVVVGLIVVRILWKRSGRERKDELNPLSAKEKALLEKDLDRFQSE